MKVINNWKVKRHWPWFDYQSGVMFPYDYKFVRLGIFNFHIIWNYKPISVGMKEHKDLRSVLGLQIRKWLKTLQGTWK